MAPSKKSKWKNRKLNNTLKKTKVNWAQNLKTKTKRKIACIELTQKNLKSISAPKERKWVLQLKELLRQPAIRTANGAWEWNFIHYDTQTTHNYYYYTHTYINIKWKFLLKISKPINKLNTWMTISRKFQQLSKNVKNYKKKAKKKKNNEKKKSSLSLCFFIWRISLNFKWNFNFSHAFVSPKNKKKIKRNVRLILRSNLTAWKIVRVCVRTWLVGRELCECMRNHQYINNFYVTQWIS